MKCTNSYFIDCDSLLQNATGVFTKCDNYFITKCYRSLLHNTLLQNVTFTTNCDCTHDIDIGDGHP